MRTRPFVAAVRFGIALTGAVALVARYFWAVCSCGLDVGSFFAYLTIQSNILAVLVTAAAGAVALRSSADPVLLTSARTTVLALTGTSGIVFAVLVVEGQSRGTPLDVPWMDVVLHYCLPVLAALEWLHAPGRGRSQWRAIPATLAVVGCWGVVTFVRGAIIGWYPYFFLDPAQVSGIGEMAFFCVIALAIFSSLGALLVLATRVDVPAVVLAAALAVLAVPRLHAGRLAERRALALAA
ncbi:MAG: Pr6Pr family membrane protein [Microbacteriaceae bacterium]